MLKGPGNSQPHKTFDCTHKTNQSGGVDVHAIKQFTSAAACAPTQSQQVVTSSVCGSKSVTTITTTSQAALNGKGKHLGNGTAKHQVTSTSSSTVVTPTGDHMGELVSALDLLTVDPVKEERVAATLAPWFVERTSEVCEKPLLLSRAEVVGLIGMGPSAWHLDPGELSARIAPLPEPVAVTARVRLSSYSQEPLGS